jgi:hypothetical protein
MRVCSNPRLCDNSVLSEKSTSLALLAVAHSSNPRASGTFEPSSEVSREEPDVEPKATESAKGKESWLSEVSNRLTSSLQSTLLVSSQEPVVEEARAPATDASSKNDVTLEISEEETASLSAAVAMSMEGGVSMASVSPPPLASQLAAPPAAEKEKLDVEA